MNNSFFAETLEGLNLVSDWLFFLFMDKSMFKVEKTSFTSQSLKYLSSPNFLFRMGHQSESYFFSSEIKLTSVMSRMAYRPTQESRLPRTPVVKWKQY